MSAPDEAALDAVVAHLTAGLTGVTVRRGWPEEKARATGTAPVLAVWLADRPRWQPLAIERVGEADGAGDTVDVSIAYAEGQVSIALELVAAYQAQRDTRAEEVDELLTNQLPLTSALILDTAYHGQAVRFVTRLRSVEDDARGPGRAEWRATWLLAATVRRISVVNMPRHQAGGAVLSLTVT